MRYVVSALFALGLCALPFTAAAHAAKPPVERTLAAPAPVGLDHAERDALRTASAAHRDLGARRAGDFNLHLSDRDLRVIAIAVVITLLIIVIA
ncbi:MAG: hypothetical protein L6Q99_22270 [Planctomycetes bacterium]|nr:hypothetical protein [Planctomycetota bacterium]